MLIRQVTSLGFLLIVGVCSWLATVSFSVAVWADARAARQVKEGDPIAELTERLRHPVRWSFKHPVHGIIGVVAYARRLQRRWLPST